MFAQKLQSHCTQNSYQRREPNHGLLYRTVQASFLSFIKERELEGRFLPRHVTKEFESFLECGVLSSGFMRLKCGECKHEKLVGFSCKKRGFCSSCGAKRMSEQGAFLTDWVFPHGPNENVRQWVVSFPIQLRYWMARDSKLLSRVLRIVIRVLTNFQKQKAKSLGFEAGESGTVTVVQRFGGSVNLNIHFHILAVEGVYRESKSENDPTFFELPPPTNAEVEKVLSQIQSRVVRNLKRRGLLEPDENIAENLNKEAGSSEQQTLELISSASVQNQIAMGERAGHPVRKVGSFALGGEAVTLTGSRCGSLGGFSLHANTEVKGSERERLEKLCRYIARPPIAEMRLKEVAGGKILYKFKKEWSDGTQGVVFTPLELIEKLVALIPEPRMHLTRYHGVFAPNHRLRDKIVPKPPELVTTDENVNPRDPRKLSWAELLKRVFQLDLTTCPDCGGVLKFIAAITEQAVIEKILTSLNLAAEPPRFHPPRAPPQMALFDETFT